MMAAPRLPTKADFPPSVSLSITAPPSSQPATNILLLLHGLGDTLQPFTRLASQLQLPYTCIISLCGPTPVPALMTGSDEPSFTWGDDVVFDQTTGALEMDAGFKSTETMVLEAVIRIGLVGKCGYRLRDVHLLGFGQGGIAALYVAARIPVNEELGGVICIGGRMPSGSWTGKKKTPILLLGGSKSRVVTKTAVADVKANFENVEYIKWAKDGDSMPGNRDEMFPLMKFWARRLGSRAGVPEGASEVGR